MRVQRFPSGDMNVWLSARDTHQWAHKPGAWWPCSQLAGHRVFVQLAANGDLVDLQIDGGRGEQDVDSNELNAILQDKVTA